MGILEGMKMKYENHLLDSANQFIEDANLDFEEMRLIYRFINDYLLKDKEAEDEHHGQKI